MGNKRNRNAGRDQRLHHGSTGGDRRGASAGSPRSSGRTGIVVHSNAPWAGTGYGVQAANLTRQIKATGRPVTFSSNYGLYGGITDWEGVEVLPNGYHPYSCDILTAHTQHAAQTTGAKTTLLTLFDTWVYDGANIDGIDLVASWVPVDHLPLPPKVAAWSNRPTVMSIAMSQFGLAQLERAGIAAEYAPHSVDTDTFRPDATVDGASGRDILNIPDDAFVVGMVAANKGSAPIRKAFGENLLAMGEFMARHTDVVLYMHTESRGASMGIDLKALAAACGIPADRIVWVDQWAYYAGLGPDILATIMASFDVHLLCSRGEGFGVPVLEAAACGVPSIVSDFSAQPELVTDFGYLATVQPYWDASASAWFATPLVHSIVDQLEGAYSSATNPLRRAAARQHALTYEHNKVFTKCWEPILHRIDERVANGDSGSD
jgi:hypothetical protein